MQGKERMPVYVHQQGIVRMCEFAFMRVAIFVVVITKFRVFGLSCKCKVCYQKLIDG